MLICPWHNVEYVENRVDMVVRLRDFLVVAFTRTCGVFAQVTSRSVIVLKRSARVDAGSGDDGVDDGDFEGLAAAIRLSTHSVSRAPEKGFSGTLLTGA